MNITEYNRKAWDREVERGNKWTVPVDETAIRAARDGDWTIVLTPEKSVPRAWFPDPLRDVDTLCLASGGGQQGPILAAAGARVTVFDNSPKQLARDREVADRESLTLETVCGDMADLSVFDDACFDVIVHPASNCFVRDLTPVWREAFRVLRPGGCLLTGFANPSQFIFDDPWEAPDAADAGKGLRVVFELPYDELVTIPESRRQAYVDAEEPLMFGHSLDAQIGGQLAAGFLISGFYEDGNSSQYLARYMPTFMATRALKPTAG